MISYCPMMGSSYQAFVLFHVLFHAEDSSGFVKFVHTILRRIRERLIATFSTYCNSWQIFRRHGIILWNVEDIRSRCISIRWKGALLFVHCIGPLVVEERYDGCFRMNA